ncbi:MAG: ParB N-terminal domain-containing protein, partial [archaeon]|nr:ParB N-terminal domain-containing protein [archaeon]
MKFNGGVYIITDIKIKTVSIDDVYPSVYNPRRMLDEDKAKLKNNLKRFGLVDPIIINLKNNRIIGGHQRFDVLKDSGVKEFYLIELGDIGWLFTTTDLEVIDSDYEKALNISLNKITGDFDTVKLRSLMEDLQLRKFDLSLTGFDDLELKKLDIDLNPLNSSDEVVEEDEYCITDDVETNIQVGDLFKLGNHRLVCGDCLDSTVMEKLMQEDTADMVFTDPPYLMDFTGSVHSDGSK